MSKIGKLFENPDGALVGSVKTQMDFGFRLVANPEAKRNDKSPSHLVMVGDVEIGAAWRRTITRGEHSGLDMYSLSMDDPSFPDGLDVAAFPTGRPGEREIVWTRQAPKVGGNGTAAAGGAGGQSGPPAGRPDDPPPVDQYGNPL